MKVGGLLLRGTVGGAFVGHGTQKLFGTFGGHGLKATAGFFEQIGLRPGLAQATLAGLSETGGGLGLLLGYQTPFAASAIVATMLTAITRVHLKNGPWITNSGYEYNAVLIAASVAIAEAGPGKLSLDARRGSERSGLGWGLAALGLGAAGAAVAHFVTEEFFPAPVVDEDATPAVADVLAVPHQEQLPDPVEDDVADRAADAEA